MKTRGYGGVVFWYQDISSWVSVNAYPLSTGITVIEYIDGIFNVNNYNYRTSLDRWYNLKVEADSETGALAVYLDNAYLFTHVANTAHRTGLSGVIAGNAGGYFDDFRLTSDDIPPIPIVIDIKPGDGSNMINPESKGKIPVAILSTNEFNAPEMVDWDTLTFGREGSEESLAFCDRNSQDLNGDGLMDVVGHFYTQKTDFQCTDKAGILSGKTVEGTPTKGSDSVNIVPHN